MRFRLRLSALVLAIPAIAAPATAQDRAIAPEAIRAHVEFLAGDLLEGRDAGTRGHALAAHYVATRFAAAGLVPAVDRAWYQHVPLPDGRESPNVLALLPGSDPALAGEVVVVMAHLDHLGIAADEAGDAVFNGALDNAAGVAVLLEVARALAAAPKRPKRPILFAAVTAEEDGLLGSTWLARNPVTRGKVVAAINFDMPVLLYDFTDIVAVGAERSTLGLIVAAAAARGGVALSTDPLPEEDLFRRSDHYAFVRTGVPAVFVTTGFANGGAAIFREFLAKHYHRASDQLDLPFDWAAGAKFATVNTLIARAIADSPRAPLWYAGDEFGDRFAKRQKKAVRPPR